MKTLITCSALFHGHPVVEPILNVFGQIVPLLKVFLDFLVIIARVYQLS